MDLKETLKKYHNKELVRDLSRQIASISQTIGPVKLMHICGTHEHEIVQDRVAPFVSAPSRRLIRQLPWLVSPIRQS